MPSLSMKSEDLLIFPEGCKDGEGFSSKFPVDTSCQIPIFLFLPRSVRPVLDKFIVTVNTTAAALYVSLPTAFGSVTHCKTLSAIILEIYSKMRCRWHVFAINVPLFTPQTSRTRASSTKCAVFTKASRYLYAHLGYGRRSLDWCKLPAVNSLRRMVPKSQSQ